MYLRMGFVYCIAELNRRLNHRLVALDRAVRIIVHHVLMFVFLL